MRCGVSNTEDGGLAHHGKTRREKAFKSAGDQTGC